MMHRVIYLTGVETLELRVEPVPVPAAGELVLRIGAATTCGTDVKVFRRGGHPRMLRVPSPFGHELAGTISAAGDGVEGFAVGDRVVVANSAPCGECRYCRRARENLCEDLQYLNGGFAEHLRVPQRFVARSTYRVRDETPFEIAALAEPLACVLHGIDACDLDEPSDVVVYGAGPIGLLFAGALTGAGHRVTVADPNAERLAVATAFGAAVVLQIERGGRQAERVIAASVGARGFAAAIDATGVPEVWEDALRSVAPGGVVNLFGGCAPGTAVSLDTHRVHYGEVTVRGSYHHRPATFARAVAMLERGDLDAGRLISGEVPLEDLEDALRAMIAKRALKVVVRP